MMHDRFSTLAVTLNSKKVGAGSVFVAIRGACDNGERYIPEAVARGAREIIVSEDALLDAATLKLCEAAGVPITRVYDARRSLAARAAAEQDYPAQKLCCMGITGTKGKTTTAWLTYHLLHRAGYAVALLSTVENRIGTVRYPTELTTQQADYIQAFLRACVDEGITHVVIEVAAQALTQHRVAEISFATAAWLNFSQEHGEYYAQESDYWGAKAQIFNQVAPQGIVIVPCDDERFLQITFPEGVRIMRWSYDAIVTVVNSVYDPYVSCRFEGITYVCPHLLGTHNGANLLVALMLARSVGVNVLACKQALLSFSPIPGRLNWYNLGNGARVCIDYAHNPASFEATLSALRACTDHLIVVFGAGGDRDASRRPIMGAIAARYGDVVFLTSDNPRSEDPHAICDDIFTGVDRLFHEKIVRELDRERAIRRACDSSRAGSIIALLGKGPDEYQIVHGKKTVFSEREIIQSYTSL